MWQRGRAAGGNLRVSALYSAWFDLDQYGTAPGGHCAGDARPALGETAVTAFLTECRLRLRVVALPFMLGLASLTLPVEAQVKSSAKADAVCASPPMSQDSLDRMKRRSDYVGLMARLAADCPDVAMIFMDFSVGSISGRAAGRRSHAESFISPLAWPVPSDRNY